MNAVRTALVVSVALNLLVAGALFGAWLDREPHRDSRLRGAGPMAPFAAAMPPEDRSALLAALRDEGRDARGRSRDFAESFAALLAAIRAEPFDPMQLQALLAEQRAVGIARQEAGERLLVDRIAGMSAADRAAYAERLETAFRRPRRR
jgi:uncharacterized membrane protein